MSLILAAFWGNSVEVLPNGPLYFWANLLGAAGIMANAAYHRAYPGAALNAIWAGIALWKLLDG